MMKIFPCRIYFSSLILIFLSNTCVQAQILEQESKKNSIIDDFKNGQEKLLVGVREDSYPIAYREFGEWRGFCIDLSIKLSKYIKSELELPQLVNPEYINISSSDYRFQSVKEGQVHLECGPNTIFNPQNFIYSEKIKKRYQGIDFSRPFFETGTRLIIKAENESRVKENFALDSKYFRDKYTNTVATIKNTTTEILIRSIYPNYDEESDPQTRNSGFVAVMKDEVLAFAADSIILEAALDRGRFGEESIDKDKYSLIPENSFLSYEFYGLVINKNEKSWKIFIDKFLETDEVKQLIETKLTSKYDNSAKFSRIQRKKSERNTRNSLIIQLASILFVLLLTFILASILRLIYLRYKVLKLELGTQKEFNWNIFFETINELRESYFDIKVRKIKILQIDNDDIVLVDIKIPKEKNKTTFTQQFISLYESKMSNQHKGNFGTIKISTRLIVESLVRANVGEIVRRIWF